MYVYGYGCIYVPNCIENQIKSLIWPWPYRTLGSQLLWGGCGYPFSHSCPLPLLLALPPVCHLRIPLATRAWLWIATCNGRGQWGVQLMVSWMDNLKKGPYSSFHWHLERADAGFSWKVSVTRDHNSLKRSQRTCIHFGEHYELADCWKAILFCPKDSSRSKPGWKSATVPLTDTQCEAHNNKALCCDY